MATLKLKENAAALAGASLPLHDWSITASPSPPSLTSGISIKLYMMIEGETGGVEEVGGRRGTRTNSISR